MRGILFLLFCCLSSHAQSTMPCQPPARHFTCPAYVVHNNTDQSLNKTLSIDWRTEYNRTVDCNTTDMNPNPNNQFNRTCNWTIGCNIPNVTNGSSLAFYNFTVDISTPTFRADTQLFMNIFMYRDNGFNAPELMFAMYNRSILAFRTLAPDGQSYNYIFPTSISRIPNVDLGAPYYLTSNWRETAHIVATVFTLPESNISHQTDIAIQTDFRFGCDRIERSLPCLPANRNLTCPAYVIKNINDVNSLNKTLAIDWYTEYNASTERCSTSGAPVDSNPNNQFNRTCSWRLACNIPNVTNGSVAFYNFTVDISTPTFRADTQLFMNFSLHRDNGFSAPELMFAMYNRGISAFRSLAPDGNSYNLIFPSSINHIPSVDLGAPYFLTSNWRETAIVAVDFFTLEASNTTMQTDIGITTSLHFECIQLISTVVVPGTMVPRISNSTDEVPTSSGNSVGLAVGVSIAVVVVLGAAAGWILYTRTDALKCLKQNGKECNERETPMLLMDTTSGVEGLSPALAVPATAASNKVDPVPMHVDL